MCVVKRKFKLESDIDSIKIFIPQIQGGLGFKGAVGSGHLHFLGQVITLLQLLFSSFLK